MGAKIAPKCVKNRIKKSVRKRRPKKKQKETQEEPVLANEREARKRIRVCETRWGYYVYVFVSVCSLVRFVFICMYVKACSVERTSARFARSGVSEVERLGGSWERLGSLLGASWGVLAPLGGVSGASWGRLGGRLGGQNPPLGASWRRLGGVLEPSCRG